VIGTAFSELTKLITGVHRCIAFALQLIPDDFEYSTVNGDAFLSMDATTQVRKGQRCRTP
jgi:hypothetical protein